jgi:hypothetical protein
MVADIGELRRDVLGDAAVRGDVELVAVPVAVLPGGVACLGAIGDGDGTLARLLEGSDPVDGALVDLVERRTAETVARGRLG